jgi:hypothetical protein
MSSCHWHTARRRCIRREVVSEAQQLVLLHVSAPSMHFRSGRVALLCGGRTSPGPSLQVDSAFVALLPVVSVSWKSSKGDLEVTSGTLPSALVGYTYRLVSVVVWVFMARLRTLSLLQKHRKMKNIMNLGLAMSNSACRWQLHT